MGRDFDSGRSMDSFHAKQRWSGTRITKGNTRMKERKRYLFVQNIVVIVWLCYNLSAHVCSTNIRNQSSWRRLGYDVESLSRGTALRGNTNASRKQLVYQKFLKIASPKRGVFTKKYKNNWGRNPENRRATDLVLLLERNLFSLRLLCVVWDIWRSQNRHALPNNGHCWTS